jgi:hypothetical protein
VGSGASLLPLLQQVHRRCKILHKQLPPAEAMPTAATAGSGRQLQKEYLHDIGQLLALQHDVLAKCLEPPVSAVEKMQLWLSPDMADAGLQLLAVTCYTWQQQLADRWQRQHSSQQQQANAPGQQQQQLLPLQRALLAK